MENHKTTPDMKFVEEHAESFDLAEKVSNQIVADLKGQYCYCFLMIKPNNVSTGPLHVASNMDGTGLAELLAEAYDKVSKDSDFEPSGHDNA